MIYCGGGGHKVQCCNSEGDSGVDIFFMTCSIVSKIKMKVLPVDIYIPDYPLSFDWTTESNVTCNVSCDYCKSFT